MFFWLYQINMKNNKKVIHDVISTTYAYQNNRNGLTGTLENNLTNYWKDRLKGVEPLNLFTDYPRSAVQRTNKASTSFFIDEESNKQLGLFSEKHSVTLFATLLAAYKVLLYRYTNQEDICIGNVILNDEGAEYFLNALPLRTELNGNDQFRVLLQRTNATINEAYKHKRFPFEKIINIPGNESGADTNPLYQVMFLLQNGSELPDVTQYTSKSDLAFILNEEPSGLYGTVEYNASLYKEDTIFRIIDHYKQLLIAAIADPQKKISSFPMLTKAEEHKLLNELNNTAFEYPKDKSLIDLFEDQVKKTPGNIAVIFGDLELTYYELNCLGNQFGGYLIKNYSVKPDDLIGVKLDRSDWMMVAILGILKAGGAYVPIDPEYPQERINYMLHDSACKILVDEHELQKFKRSQSKYSRENQAVGLKAHHLVYCIYTSGSTGNPKGVLVEHRNVVNLILSQQKVYNITEDERVLQFTTITFDPSAEQIWIAFLTGAALVVLSKANLMDIKALESYIIEKKVSHIHTVPAYLAELSIKDMRNVKRVITGGESCSPVLAKKWENCCMFINEYGPTETTITSVEYKADTSDNYHVFVPIGRPVANTQIYIFDDYQHLLPYGALGEIYIGGDGVTRGYLNRAELTAERFITNPHRTNERIYRTGDLGRWLPDGNIEYLGRIDDQVKIRGYRIELDEIITVLQKHNKVNAAVVIARAIKGPDKELIAYTTGDADADELRSYLKEQLPSYMVPGYFVHLELMPLTNNGKINKKELPVPEECDYEKQGTFIQPATATEKIIAGIWQDVLNIERIGIDDDFFDLGGTSLMVIKIINRINKETTINLSISSLFHLSTIRQLAHSIETNTTNELSPVILLKKGEGTPLFIFPPWSSYPTIFNEFTQSYKGKNPLYGIVYTEDSEDFPYKTVQEYVQHLIIQIKMLYPTGPYGLLGYSMGARTVLEVAMQLQQANDDVALLAVISHFPAFPSKRILSNRRLLDEIRIFSKISPGLKFKYLYLRLPHFTRLLINGKHNLLEFMVDIETQKKILEIHEAYETDLKYNGDLLLIHETRPEGDAAEFKKAQVYRNSIFKKLWRKYITGNIIVKIVECRHVDFFKKPAVEEVVSVIVSYLK
jgi:amino acid adenylation domain-containing protein